MQVSPTVSGGSSCSFVVAEFAALHRQLAERGVVVDPHVVARSRVSAWITTWWPIRQPGADRDVRRRSRSARRAWCRRRRRRWDAIDAASSHDPRAAAARSATGAPPASSDACAAASTCTTRRPSAPSVSGRLALAHAVDEVLALELERLLQRDLGDQDVAAAHRSARRRTTRPRPARSTPLS